MARITFYRLLLIAALPAIALSQADERLKQAGVCARCHVVSVVEWSMSAHPKANTDCVACHGSSKGHVADERNNVKPERLPHAERIAALCASCHTDGCPKTKTAAGCQTCHHVHALIDPRNAPSTKDERLEALTAKSRDATRRIEAGTRLELAGNCADAHTEFQAALALLPNDPTAQAGLRRCDNQLRRSWPGFQMVGSERDPTTGLPRLVRVQTLPIEMALVPGGDGDLGSDRFAASKPVHTIRVEPFYLARFEVTQALWSSVMGSNPSAHQGKDFPDAARLPVEQVSWQDAQLFLEKLNRLVPGGGFRLPTEAEWEIAARSDGSAPAVSATPQPAPHATGSSQPNKLGLFDMQGNVWEWCSSLAAPYPYNSEDGREAAEAKGLRVLRGGGYADTPDLLDPSLRHSERPERRMKWNGLRIARGIPAP
jgi:formylglycine-generating enzyme required for sulfatase activity